MKKTILLVLSGFVFAAIHAQDVETKESYSVSGGILGAANFSKFRITENNHTNIEYDTKTGWSVGGWVNFPVGSGFSIEPQLMYSSYRYFTPTTTPVLLKDGKIRYISVPVLLKFHVGDKFAITAGPQVDFTSSLERRNNSTGNEGDFKQTSFSGFGGIEIFPRGRVTIFGRYIHGFSNMNDVDDGPTAMEYKNQNIQAGIKLRLFGSKRSAPQVTSITTVADTDGDGINDDADKCPNQYGVAKYDGCPVPDTDGDGINDEMDKCPNQAGTAKYNGCPIPDTDGDGINDEEDKCPNQAGTADRSGCPVTDKDNDGISDDVDKCPDVAGIASNNGCPEVPANVTKSLMASAQNISFGATNAKLTTKSNTSLNQVITLLNENPTLKLRIEGHTDNAGDDDANMTLSQDRAAAVKAYLVSKGISEDRITTEGFGETMPIADNTTASGRMKNRRIEIKVDY
jgi:outer membrane protein OmpA-like peptidoglycan-associated protein